MTKPATRFTRNTITLPPKTCWDMLPLSDEAARLLRRAHKFAKEDGTLVLRFPDAKTLASFIRATKV